MRKESFHGHQYQIAEVTVDETAISGTGGAVYPRLIIPFVLHLSALASEIPTEWRFTELTAQLLISPGVGKISDNIPVQLHEKRLSTTRQSWDSHVLMEYPLDGNRIAHIEKMRAGGDLRLQLHVSLLATEFFLVPEQKPNSILKTVVGPQGSHRLTTMCSLHIPQSTWINRVLTNIGFGKIHFLELPAVPLEACEAMEHSYKALVQAQELHKEGFYDDCVGRCRLAIEKLLVKTKVTDPDGTTREVPVLPPSWETKVGKSTYDWLSGILTPLKNATNKPHHSPNSHYDQLESQLILMIVTGLVAYAARQKHALAE